MKILYVHADEANEWNCSEHRIMVPFRAIRRSGLAECEVTSMRNWENPNLPYELDELTKQADLVILQRNIFGTVLNKIAYMRGINKPAVVDLDDAYNYMEASTGSPSSEFWRYGIVTQPNPQGGEQKFVVDPLPWKSLVMGVKMCGAMSSPSQLIMEDWAEFGARSYFVPNYLNLERYVRQDVYREPGKIYVGGGGSQGHIKSWKESGIYDALEQIIHEDGRVQFVYIGHTQTASYLKVPAARKISFGWIPYSGWANKLSLMDIGLIPLCGEYDRRRSFLKTAEYQVLGMPWLGSDLEPNRHFGVDLIQNTPEAWYVAIKEAVNHVDDLKAEALRKMPEWREKLDINNNVGRILKTYERMIEEYE